MVSNLKVATPQNYQVGATFQSISTGQKMRIISHSRGDEFVSVVEGVCVEITQHSRHADHFYLLEPATNTD